MKKLLAIIILSLCLITSSNADDIRDFQIEGISIGDSALDYFSESRIKKTIRTDWPKSKKFSRSFGLKSSNMTTYDDIMIVFKTNDKKYKISSIQGGIYFKNFKDCYPRKNKIKSEIMKQFSDLKHKSIKKPHSLDKKSSVDVTYIYFKAGGFIQVACYDWSNKIEKERGYKDHLKVGLNSGEFRKWLNTEAY